MPDSDGTALGQGDRAAAGTGTDIQRGKRRIDDAAIRDDQRAGVGQRVAGIGIYAGEGGRGGATFRERSARTANRRSNGIVRQVIIEAHGAGRDGPAASDHRIRRQGIIEKHVVPIRIQRAADPIGRPVAGARIPRRAHIALPRQIVRKGTAAGDHQLQVVRIDNDIGVRVAALQCKRARTGLGDDIGDQRVGPGRGGAVGEAQDDIVRAVHIQRIAHHHLVARARHVAQIKVKRAAVQRQGVGQGQLAHDIQSARRQDTAPVQNHRAAVRAVAAEGGTGGHGQRVGGAGGIAVDEQRARTHRDYAPVGIHTRKRPSARARLGDGQARDGVGGRANDTADDAIAHACQGQQRR